MSELLDGGKGGAAGFPGITRKVLERHRMPESAQELVLFEITYSPGAAAPPHRHPVAGLVYIVEGVAESAYGDDAPRRYQAGETLQDRAYCRHTLFRNCDPERPLRFLAFYALEPGRSYTIPA